MRQESINIEAAAQRKLKQAEVERKMYTELLMSQWPIELDK